MADISTEEGRGAVRRNVQAYPPVRTDELPQRAAQIVGEPAGQRLAAVKFADAVSGVFERGAHLGVEAPGRRSASAGTQIGASAGIPSSFALHARRRHPPLADIPQDAAHGFFGLIRSPKGERNCGRERPAARWSHRAGMRFRIDFLAVSTS